LSKLLGLSHRCLRYNAGCQFRPLARRGQVGLDLGGLLLDRVDARAVAFTALEVVDALRDPVTGGDRDVVVVASNEDAGVVAAGDDHGRGDADRGVHVGGV
jgi:hypothetical protein